MSKSYNRCLSRDVINALSDSEVKQLMMSYKTQIVEGGRKNNENKALEMDYCYLQREWQLRQSRAR
tara:strand:+ start:209 stop:406 length:198 start_codon:yes stop_codon:yes gene_type:complete